MGTTESTVRYGAYDGRLRIEQAKQLAKECVDPSAVHSWVDGKYFVITVDKRKLVIDLLRGKYDIAVDGEVMGKYTTWDDAAAKFRALLSEPGAAEIEAD